MLELLKQMPNKKRRGRKKGKRTDLYPYKKLLRKKKIHLDIFCFHGGAKCRMRNLK